MAKLQPKVRRQSTTKGGLTLWRGWVFCEECEGFRYKGRCPGHCKGLCGFKSEDDAWPPTLVRQAEIIQGASVTPSETMTLNEAADDFFSRPRPSSVREDTFDVYRRAWNARIRGTIGKKQIINITRPDVSDWLDLLAMSEKDPLAENSISRYLSALNRCGFDHAVNKLGIMSDNPARDQEIPASENIPLPGARIFTIEEIYALAMLCRSATRS